MEYVSTRLLARDVAAAIRFWRDVMKLSLNFQDERSGYAYFDMGKAGLESVVNF